MKNKKLWVYLSLLLIMAIFLAGFGGNMLYILFNNSSELSLIYKMIFMILIYVWIMGLLFFIKLFDINFKHKRYFQGSAVHMFLSINLPCMLLFIVLCKSIGTLFYPILAVSTLIFIYKNYKLTKKDKINLWILFVISVIIAIILSVYWGLN